jgi:hypothetical protein
MPRNPERLTVSEDDLEYIWQQIKLSYKYHEPFIAKGREVIEYREGRRFTSFVATEFNERQGGGPPKIGRVPINLFQTYHEILRPTIAGQKWRPVASTHSSQFFQAAQREEDLIAWNHEVTDFQTEFSMAATDRLDFGRGVIKTGIGEPFGMRAMDVALQTPTVDPLTGRAAPLGDIMKEIVGSANGQQVAHGDYEHPAQGGRRYPKGSVWQQRISPEDVWGDYAARHMRDSRYMVQKHYLPERTMKKVLKSMGLQPSVIKDLLPYELALDFDYLEQELDKRRGYQWAKNEEREGRETIFKMYEFWWREEGKLVFLVEGIEEKPILVRRWGAPEGEYPYEFWDRATRGDRVNPEPEFNGLQSDQDQVNIASSIRTDVVRRMKAIVGVLESYIHPDDIKLIEEGGPLATVRLKKAIKEVLQVMEIKMDTGQLTALISDIEASSRRRHGISLEDLGSPSNTDTATQQLIMDASGKMLKDDRMRGAHTFLTRCVKKHSRYHRLAYHQWPQAKARPEAAMYGGAMGLPSGPNEPFYPMDEGFTREELLYEKRWNIEIMAESPSERDEQLKRTESIINMHGNAGWLNMREIGIYQLELAQVNRQGLVNPDPEDMDPAEEHAAFLLGMPVNQSQHENHARHFAKHSQFVKEVGILVTMKQTGKAQPPPFMVTPTHVEYVRDVMEKGGQAMQALMAHAENTMKMMGGKGGGQSMAQSGAMDTNRLREGQGAQRLRAEEGKPIPFGAQNTKLGEVAR